jgi:serine/threonine protein kinase
MPLNPRKAVTFLILSAFLGGAFGPIPAARADEFLLPAPGAMVRLSPPFSPPILRGIKVHRDDPFRIDFILDQGAGQLANPQLKAESTILIKYFLASLTIPEKDLWVNLSPYEKDRIIPPSFGLTEMGRDLLAEDYLLKQITASLIYPEGDYGKKFWQRIYEEAQKKFGTTNVPVNTFNKVWIVPQKAAVYENAGAGTAYVVESKLKVMLEEDYLSLGKNASPARQAGAMQKDTSSLGSRIVSEIVIPQLTREINDNRNFARLRQVYNSLILAAWYKKKVKDSILEAVYADKTKVAGVGYENSVVSADAAAASMPDAEKIYQLYLQAFRKGVFNYIKEESDPLTRETFPRKYFSGGVDLAMTGRTNMQGTDQAMIITSIPPAVDLVNPVEISAELEGIPDIFAGRPDKAMSSRDINDRIRLHETIGSKMAAVIREVNGLIERPHLFVRQYTLNRFDQLQKPVGRLLKKSPLVYSIRPADTSSLASDKADLKAAEIKNIRIDQEIGDLLAAVLEGRRNPEEFAKLQEERYIDDLKILQLYLRISRRILSGESRLALKDQLGIVLRGLIGAVERDRRLLDNLNYRLRLLISDGPGRIRIGNLGIEFLENGAVAMASYRWTGTRRYTKTDVKVKYPSIEKAVSGLNKAIKGYRKERGALLFLNEILLYSARILAGTSRMAGEEIQKRPFIDRLTAVQRWAASKYVTEKTDIAAALETAIEGLQTTGISARKEAINHIYEAMGLMRGRLNFIDSQLDLKAGQLAVLAPYTPDQAMVSSREAFGSILQAALTAQVLDQGLRDQVNVFNQRQKRIESSPTGRIVISPSARHTIQFGGLSPQKAYKVSLELSQDHNVWVHFIRKKEQHSYEIIHFEYDSGRNNPLTIIAHKIDARVLVSRAIHDALTMPSKGAIEAFNEEHLSLESSDTGRIVVTPAARHTIQFGELPPNTAYTVSLALIEGYKVRVILEGQEGEQVAFDIENYEYLSGRTSQKIFLAHKTVDEVRAQFSTALQEVLTGHSRETADTFNQKQLTLESSRTGAIAIVPAARHNIQFLGLAPRTVYRLSLDLTDTNKVRVNFVQGKTVLTYQIDNYEFVPGRTKQVIFLGHKVNDMRDQMARALRDMLLAPTQEAVDAFNQQQLTLESSDSGGVSITPVVRHTIQFQGLPPNSVFRVGLDLTGDHKVRVIFVRGQEVVSYQIDGFQYDPALHDQKTFMAHKVRNLPNAKDQAMRSTGPQVDLSVVDTELKAIGARLNVSYSGQQPEFGKVISAGGEGTVYYDGEDSLQGKFYKLFHLPNTGMEEVGYIKYLNGKSVSGIPRLLKWGNLKGSVWIHMDGIERAEGIQILDEEGIKQAQTEHVVSAQHMAYSGIWKGLNFAQRLAAMAKVARILSDAHEQGISHNDVKPLNIVMNRDKEVMVIDWNKATRFGQEQMGGTAGFVAPEEYHKTDKSDVYSLGKTIFYAMKESPEYFEHGEAAVFLREFEDYMTRSADQIAKRPSMKEAADYLEKIAQKAAHPADTTIKLEPWRPVEMSYAKKAAQSVWQAAQGLLKRNSDKAMTAGPGGIDLTAAKVPLDVQNSGQLIQLHLDPAILEKLQNTAGFAPVIIDIRPMSDVKLFLGLEAPVPVQRR